MVIHWFRRDLRLSDNAALYQALSNHNDVQCVFIFDKNILDKLLDKDDARVTFIHNQLMNIQDQLTQLNSDLKIYYGEPSEVWNTIIKELKPSCKSWCFWVFPMFFMDKYSTHSPGSLLVAKSFPFL